MRIIGAFCSEQEGNIPKLLKKKKKPKKRSSREGCGPRCQVVQVDEQWKRNLRSTLEDIRKKIMDVSVDSSSACVDP